mgnify:CR=1 FL=1
MVLCLVFPSGKPSKITFLTDSHHSLAIFTARLLCYHLTKITTRYAIRIQSLADRNHRFLLADDGCYFYRSFFWPSLALLFGSAVVLAWTDGLVSTEILFEKDGGLICACLFLNKQKIQRLLS